MRGGWGARESRRRAAAALVVLTLVPVAAMIGSAPSHAPSAPTPLFHVTTMGGAVASQDVLSPTVDALRRGEASNLFASFAWTGVTAYGAFALFGFDVPNGRILQYSAMSPDEVLPLVSEIDFQDFSATAAPSVAGPTFVATGRDVVVTAHDDPMALLEIRTLDAPSTVVLHFPSSGTTITQVSYSTSWPASGLAFSIGESRGQLILGAGTFNVTGMTVVANLEPWDYLALKAVPSFVADRTERTAVLDAFASGRLAAEYELVATTDGKWVENSADFRNAINTDSQTVVFNKASVQIAGSAPEGGVILMAFDRQTMPSDAAHRLVVRVNGAEIPETSDAVAPLYAAPTSLSQPFFAVLPMNATTLVIYLPVLQPSSLEVESIPNPSPTLDAGTALAMIAAVAIVSAAAAEMFRRRPD